MGSSLKSGCTFCTVWLSTTWKTFQNISTYFFRRSALISRIIWKTMDGCAHYDFEESTFDEVKSAPCKRYRSFLYGRPWKLAVRSERLVPRDCHPDRIRLWLVTL